MRNRELNQDGVGLGLTISKNLANAMGGEISVESVLGLGSKFVLSLPYKIPSSEKVKSNSVSPLSAIRSMSNN